jgi:hypothetical protein
LAISEHGSGTQTAVINTEHVLNATTPETTDGIFQFFVDINAMTFGSPADATILRIKEKCIAGGTQRTIYRGDVLGAPSADDAIWVSPSFLLLHGWDFTLQQTAGTGRAYPWSIRKVA